MNTDVTPRLFARDFGRGTRKAVALHCSLAHSGAWKQLATCLSDDLTITAVDLLGHGQSPDRGGIGDPTDKVIDSVLPFLDDPVDLIGHSYGGVVALRLAIEYPQKVRSLLLFEPVLMAIAHQDRSSEVDRNNDLMDEVAAEIAKGDPETAARVFMRVWGDGRRWADLPVDLRKSSTRRIGFVDDCRPTVDQDRGNIVARLGQIQVPAVIMDGAASPPIMKVIQDGIARRMPNARRVTFDGVSHMGPITHPALIADEIRKALTVEPAF